MNLEGQRFGRLTVQEYLGSQRWLVKCDCGKEKIMRTATVKAAKSCGCIRAEKSRENGEKRQNAKICPVCSKLFPCSPSSKKITCSQKCSSVRKTETHIGKTIPKESKSRISEKAKERGTPETFNKMIEANAQSPKCQRGIMNSAAKKWTIRYIETQEIFSFTNLREWVRNNLNQFDKLDYEYTDDQTVDRICHGFYTIKRNYMNGKSCITYKGWQIIGFDDRKNYERKYQI